MPEWWNWYTRRPQVPLLHALWVRVPSPVPLLLEEIWNVVFSDAITLVCRWLYCPWLYSGFLFVFCLNMGRKIR